MSLTTQQINAAARVAKLGTERASDTLEKTASAAVPVKVGSGTGYVPAGSPADTALFPSSGKDAMTQKMEAAYPFTTTGTNLYTRDANGNYVSAPNLLYGNQNIASDRSASELGLSSGSYYGNTQEELKAGIAANERETQNTLSQMAGQDALEKSAMQRANEGTSSASEAFTAKLAQGREGVMSFGNQALIGQNTERVKGIIADREAAYRLAVENRANLTKRLEEATRSNNTAAVKQLSQQLAATESNIAQQEQQALDQANKDRLFALDFNADTRAQKTMAFNQGMSTLGTLLENGVTITPSMSLKIAKDMGVPTDDIIAYNDAIDRIQKDKTLTQEAKSLALEDARTDLIRKKTGRDNEKVRELDFLSQAYARGASQDEISWIKEKFGITDYDDPFTSAKLSIEKSQAKVAAIKAEYEGKEPPYGTKDYWDMKAAEAEAKAKMADYEDQYASGESTWTPGTTGMRTDRNNNPVAMTTDVARSLGLVEGVDYVQGDKFPGNSKLYTAKLLGDGLSTVIKAFDSAANDPSKQVFYTQKGQPRWTYITMSDQEWLSKTPTEKAKVIQRMYKSEGGSGKFSFSETGKKKDVFTATQLNEGAINAGIPIAEFSKLSEDRKNMYINGYAEFRKDLKALQDGTGTYTAQQMVSDLRNSALPSDVRDNLISQVLAVASPEARGPIELERKLESFFGL